MNAEKQTLIDLIAEAGAVDFPDMLRLIHARRYTGSITFHFLKGTATSSEIPSDAVRVRLDQKIDFSRSA